MENKDYEKMTFVDLVEKWSHASPERAAVQWCEDGQCMKKTYKEFYEDILAVQTIILKMTAIGELLSAASRIIIFWFF